MKNLKKSIALFLAFAIVLTLSPIKSSAKWRDQSSNLPGFASDKDKQQAVIIGVAGGVVVVGALTYYFIHKHKMQKAVTQTGKFNTLNLLLTHQNTLLEKIETSGQALPIDLILAPINNTNNLALGKTNGVQLVFRIRF